MLFYPKATDSVVLTVEELVEWRSLLRYGLCCTVSDLKSAVLIAIGATPGNMGNGADLPRLPLHEPVASDCQLVKCRMRRQRVAIV